MYVCEVSLNTIKACYITLCNPVNHPPQGVAFGEPCKTMVCFWDSTLYYELPPPHGRTYPPRAAFRWKVVLYMVSWQAGRIGSWQGATKGQLTSPCICWAYVGLADRAVY